MTMRPSARERRVTTEEAARSKPFSDQISVESPELTDRHDERAAADRFAELLRGLKAAREAQGLSLADVTARTGMDRSALSKLETGQRPNPTLETLVRYAEAVGKRLVVSLADA